MKADTVAALFMLILALGGAAGAYFWFDNNRRVENANYEAAIDDVTDRELRAGQLGFALDGVAGRPDKLAFLRELYADPSRSQTLSLGFGYVLSNWSGSYEAVADQFNREAEPQRLQAEIDERFGDGAYALMQAQRQQFLRDASQIAADRAARDQRELQRTIRAYQAFVARNHRQPRNGEEIPMGP